VEAVIVKLLRPINQSIHQADHPSKQSIKPIDSSTSELIHQSKGWFSQSINQPINQSINQSINQPINHWIYQSIESSVKSVHQVHQSRLAIKSINPRDLQGINQQIQAPNSSRMVQGSKPALNNLASQSVEQHHRVVGASALWCHVTEEAMQRVL
jgi:hypothetical protein